MAFAVFFPTVSFLAVVATALLLNLGGQVVLNGMATIGMLVAFFQYTDQMFAPIRNMAENYNTLQAASAEVLKNAGSIAQFLDRDARADFAGPSGMQGFLLSFLNDPAQDLDAFLAGIQSYYDSLPPEG